MPNAESEFFRSNELENRNFGIFTST